jgi:hypothetical protein
VFENATGGGACIVDKFSQKKSSDGSSGVTAQHQSAAHEQQRVTSLNSTRFCLIADVHFSGPLQITDIKEFSNLAKESNTLFTISTHGDVGGIVGTLTRLIKKEEMRRRERFAAQSGFCLLYISEFELFFLNNYG